jgi:hypothetical protein
MEPEGAHPVTENETSLEPASSSWAWVILAWFLVSIPLLWGIWQTVKKAAVLFR